MKFIFALLFIAIFAFVAAQENAAPENTDPVGFDLNRFKDYGRKFMEQADGHIDRAVKEAKKHGINLEEPFSHGRNVWSQWMSQ